MTTKTTKTTKTAKTMKVLIAYDGSECADQAIEELPRAGLPAAAEALVVSVEEAWVPLPPISSYELIDRVVGTGGGAAVQRSPETEEYHIEAEGLAKRAKAAVEKLFPAWQVTEKAVTGSPASEILKLADDWKADLLVVGSHGRSALGRFVFGSVSHQIITHAKCVVRVARCGAEVRYGTERILVGVDGSLGADAAIEEVMRRKFPAATEIRLVIVCDPLKPTPVGYLVPKVKRWIDEGNREEAEWASDVVRQQAERLREAGLITSFAVKDGDPRRVLLDEAEEWNATTIFVGARGLTRFDRFLLGSVSAAVAQRAVCSVEIVR